MVHIFDLWLIKFINQTIIVAIIEMLCLQMKSLSMLSPLSRRLLAAFGTRTFKVRYDKAHQAFVPLPMNQSEVRAYPMSQFELAYFQVKNEVQLFRESQVKKVDTKFKAGDQHWAAFNFQTISCPNTAQQFEGILRQQKGYFDNSEIIRLYIKKNLDPLCLFAPPRLGKTTSLRILQAFFGLPFKTGQIDELKMRFYAQSFQKLNICKKSTQQQWQEYKCKYMHKYVVLRIQFPEVNETTTQKEVIEELIKKLAIKLNQVGATNILKINESKNLPQLALNLASVFESNTITQQNRPILLIDQTEKIFQRTKELYRLSKDDSEKQHLLNVCQSFVLFLHTLSKRKGIHCIMAGSQLIYDYLDWRMDNLHYIKECQLYRYFLPTTQEFERKVKQDYPLCATREQLKLVSVLYHGYRWMDEGYTSLHSAFKLLANRDQREYVQENLSVSPYFRQLLKQYKNKFSYFLRAIAKHQGIYREVRSQQKVSFKSSMQRYQFYPSWIQIQLMQEGVVLFNYNKQQYIKCLNLKKANVLLRFIETNLPFQLGFEIQKKMASKKISTSLSFGQIDTVCKVVTECIKRFIVINQIKRQSEMAAAFGTGFSFLTNLLPSSRTTLNKKLLQDNINKYFYGFDKQRIVIAQYNFCEKVRKQELAKKADGMKDIIFGYQNQSNIGKGVDGKGGEIKLDSQNCIYKFKDEKQVSRVFVVGVAMNSSADCYWSIMELMLRRQAQSFWAKQVGTTSGSLVGDVEDL